MKSLILNILFAFFLMINFLFAKSDYFTEGVNLFKKKKFEEAQFTDTNFFKPEIELTIIVEDEFGYDEMPFEEFVMEEFTDFLETNDLTDSFQQELIVEEITEQQFFDELADQMVEELGGPSLDEYFETDSAFIEMPMPGEGEIYLTDSEMNSMMEANPEMFEQVDENTILIKLMSLTYLNPCKAN